MRKVINTIKYFVVIAVMIAFHGTAIADASASHTVSGIITAYDGTPLSNVGVQLTNDNITFYSGCTNADGQYSITAPENSNLYRIRILAQSHIRMGCPDYVAPAGSNAPDDFRLESNQSTYTYVDLSASGQVRNFSLPTVKLTVTTVDDNGSPIVGRYAYTENIAFQEEDVVLGGSSLTSLGETRLRTQLTDGNGQVSGYVVKGVTFPASSICGTTLQGAGFCNQYPLVVNDDTSITISPLAPPVMPTGLAIHSPTQAPQLSWESITGASFYSVYRENVKIDTVTSPSYLDVSAPEGVLDYSVSAHNPSGEGPKSNFVSVIVDRTRPGIIHHISPMVNTHGWHKSNPTIAFTCSDSLSGIKSCSPPVTVSVEGANQLVVGTAVDNAENSTSTTAYVNLDKTPPTVSKPKMSNRLIIFSGSVKISAVTSDSLSGVERGEYFIDEDPGQGNGTRMTYNKGKLTARTSISGLSLGRHTVYMRSLDVAGNWSATTSVTFTYVGFPSFWKALILQFLYR